MVETYTGTLFHPTNLHEAEIKLLFFEEDRYARKAGRKGLGRRTRWRGSRED